MLNSVAWILLSHRKALKLLLKCIGRSGRFGEAFGTMKLPESERRKLNIRLATAVRSTVILGMFSWRLKTIFSNKLSHSGYAWVKLSASYAPASQLESQSNGSSTKRSLVGGGGHMPHSMVSARQRHGALSGLRKSGARTRTRSGQMESSRDGLFWKE